MPGVRPHGQAAAAGRPRLGRGRGGLLQHRVRPRRLRVHQGGRRGGDHRAEAGRHTQGGAAQEEAGALRGDMQEVLQTAQRD